ncbi:MAG: hypothetical protein KDC46_06030 [Thermoleophilia bacterium]|nr:hypothetical protein [Thermoleophilia bacterium]
MRVRSLSSSIFALAACAAALLAPSTATATSFNTVSVDTSGDKAVKLDATGGTGGQFTVTGTGGTYTITDALGPLDVGTGCVATAMPNVVTCTTEGRVFSSSSASGNILIDVTATDLRLSWSHTGAGPLVARCATTVDCFVSGSTGNDTITGSARRDTLYGNDGNDTIDAGDGDDSVDGGNGDDTLQGGGGDDWSAWGPGNDSFDGGDGFDIYYGGNALAALTVTLDDVANDGVAGELDNVRGSVEEVIGTMWSDVFWGNDSRNVFDGQDGNDEIHGGGGPDTLYGGAGDDQLFGDAGSDRLFGHRGADLLNGGPGFDRTSYESAGQMMMFADSRGAKLSLPESHNPNTTRGVVVSLDGKANDGIPGEHDNVQVEGVTGTEFDDLLIGSDSDNDLDGLGGDDRIFGKGGDDLLLGGDDDDRLVGGRGTDEMRGEAGNDTIAARDRQLDIVNCGIGRDTTYVDRTGDRVWGTCESVKRTGAKRRHR